MLNSVGCITGEVTDMIKHDPNAQALCLPVDRSYVFEACQGKKWPSAKKLKSMSRKYVYLFAALIVLRWPLTSIPTPTS